MGVFATESKMQEWLSNELEKVDGLGELIQGADWIASATPADIGEASVLASFRTSLAALHITETLFENENISLGTPDVLKPDFVLYAPETQSVVLVELKNLASPSRQAGTELGAYSAEIRTIVPFLPDGDIVHVIISQEWPVLLKHYARHEIFWQGRNLLCLRPTQQTDGSPSLEILPIHELAEDISSFQVGKGHLGGYNICLYDDQLYSSTADREKLTAAVEVFKVATQAMAVTGNRLKSHGFAFLWKDRWQQSLAPYSIVVANFAPFQSIERFVKAGDVPKVVERFIKVITEFSPEGHSNTLSEITDTCREIVSQFCSPRIEGFATWGPLSEMLNGRTEYIAFSGWGLFGRAALDEVKTRHRAGDIRCSLSSPEVGKAVLEKLIDDKYEVLDLSYYFYDPNDGVE